MDPQTSTPKSLLVVVTSDPRSSHRPAEAIRIAAGVAAWRKVDVSLYLAGPAVLALSSDVDDFVNEESFTQYLPMMAQSGRPVLVEAGAEMLLTIGEPTLRFEAIGRTDLAAMTSKMTYLLRF
jgi:hypothetical protein